MTTFNFYKFQLIENTDFKNTIEISEIIKSLQKKYPKVNFIKFSINWGDLVFLADQNLGDYIKIPFLMKYNKIRPKYFSSRLLLLKGNLYNYQIRNFFKNPSFSSNFHCSYYGFGPNYKKAFNREFTSNSLGSIAEIIINKNDNLF